MTRSRSACARRVRQSLLPCARGRPIALINDTARGDAPFPRTQGLSLNHRHRRSAILSFSSTRTGADGRACACGGISCALRPARILDAALLGEGEVTGPLTFARYIAATLLEALFCYEAGPGPRDASCWPRRGIRRVLGHDHRRDRRAPTASRQSRRSSSPHLGEGGFGSRSRCRR